MDNKEVISQTQGITERTTNPPLAVDVIIEILTWLPVLALLRFKTVCKDWKALIEDDNFIFKHYKRSFHCVCREHQQEHPGFELMIRDIYNYLGIYYGMVVEKGIFRRKYRIRNPATRQNLELPDPHGDVFSMFLAHISSSFKFKLISFYDNGKRAGNGCQILTLDGSENLSWRAMIVPNLHQLGEKRLHTKFVHIGAVVHCVMVAESGSNLSMHVLSINIQNEWVINTIKPQDCFEDLTDVEPFKFNEELAFAEVVKEGLQVYTLEAHKDLVKKVILPLTFFKGNPEMKDYLFIFAIKGSEFWFRWRDKKLFVYDIELGKITCMAHLLALERYAFPLKPSLFALKGMEPTKRITPNRFTVMPKPLQSVVNAKLKQFCQDLASKFGAKKPKLAKAKSKAYANVPMVESKLLTLADEQYNGDIKSHTSSNGCSSTEFDMSFFDFSGLAFDVLDNLFLHKLPFVEVGWATL